MTGGMLALASRFALKQFGRQWRGDCPACGYAGSFAAMSGTSGKPVMHCFNGCDRDTLHAALGSEWTLPPRPDTATAQRNQQTRQDRVRRLWNCALPCLGTLAETYLARRGIENRMCSGALRFLPDCSHPSGSRHPALVSAVRDATVALVEVQRTYLSRDTRKTLLDPARAALGPVRRAAMQLDPCGPALIVGDGMESTASASNLLALPAWAALSLKALALPLFQPALAREIEILVLAHLNQPGPAIPIALAQRQLVVLVSNYLGARQLGNRIDRRHRCRCAVGQARHSCMRLGAQSPGPRRRSRRRKNHRPRLTGRDQQRTGELWADYLAVGCLVIKPKGGAVDPDTEGAG